MLVKSQVKYIQSLSQKKQRDSDKRFVAEGPKIINELLAAPNIALVQLFAEQSWCTGHSELLAAIAPEKIHLLEKSELERISFLTTPNEVLGIFGQPEFATSIQPEGNITLMLDGIQDPGNLGTIIRAADWFGVKQVVCSEHCADIFSPKVVQASMGSLQRVQCLYTDLAGFLDQHAQVPVYAALLNGEMLDRFPKIEEGILLLGNESKGISASLLRPTLKRVTIPGKGGAESLNVAVAAGILLAHFT